MQGSDQPAVAKYLHRTPDSHLRYAVAHGKILFTGQTSANRELTESDSLGEVVSKLHIDKLGSIPFPHVINARTPLTTTDAWLLL
jgi:hypothetical protein